MQFEKIIVFHMDQIQDSCSKRYRPLDQEENMQSIRKSDDRGRANLGWLDSRHTFSFGHYYDPAHIGFGSLRVINEDRVLPGRGFDTHGHRDMEILTWVISGGLAHRDSLGNGSIIHPGDLQRMTAGTGVRHSEFNASDTDPVHFLQIWILPEQEGLAPGSEQKTFAADQRRGPMQLIASRDGHDGSVTIHQDVMLFACELGSGEQVSYPLDTGRQAWLQVVRGRVAIGQAVLTAGDGIALADMGEITITGDDASEVLLFDMGTTAV